MNDVQRDLHVVLDNLNIHKNPAAQRWLKRNPRGTFHHTPTHASWANLIEVFFSILGKQGLSHRVDRSTTSLRAFLLQYLEQYNQTSAPHSRGPKGPRSSSTSSRQRRRHTTMVNSRSAGGSVRGVIVRIT